MAESMTNDEIKHRILNNYAKFVSDAEPDRLSDWLVQESVISIDQWQRIRYDNPTNPDRCRALLHLLFITKHPTAFLIVRKALRERNHYLLQCIDSQESGCGFRVRSDTDNLSPGLSERTMCTPPGNQLVQQNQVLPRFSERNDTCLQELMKNFEDQKRAREAEKGRLMIAQKEHEDQKRAWEAEKARLLNIEKEHEDQNRAWEAEKARLLNSQKEHEDQKRAWESEKARLLNIQKEHEDQKRAWESEKARLLQMLKRHEDRTRAWEAEKLHLLKMQKEIIATYHMDSEEKISKLNKELKQERIEKEQLMIVHTDERRRSQASLTNDEIKERIQNIWSKFVLGVEPDRLSDWLVQENVITSDQWQRILTEHPTRQSRCRALLHFLYSIPHPRAFLVVYQYLTEDGHYLLESIDSQQPGLTLRSQSDVQAPFQDSEDKISKLEKELKQERIEKEQLMIVHTEERRRSQDKFRYMSVQMIRIKGANEGKKFIYGLAILDKELFVVTEKNSSVEVYDSTKFNFSRQWNVKGLIDPTDIGSCKRNKCLYINDCKGPLKSNEILRINSKGKLIKNWSTGEDRGEGMSVTDEATVLITVYENNKLSEYSPEGQLIREINLSFHAGICHPRHAIKLSNGHFVVSHGLRHDDLHRVCVVDADGRLKKSFGGKPGSSIGEIDSPVHLSVDENGSVMVADHQNSRILFLDPDLGYKREIFLNVEKHGLRNPFKILLDESNGRVFVADNRWDSEKKIFTDGRISIFDF